jgi:hypothetical protein
MERRTLTIEERDRIPWDGLILGYGAMLPFVAGAAAAWLWPEAAERAARWTALWGGAILIFLSGVRRGLSFRTPGGPRWPQLAMFAWLFWAGLAALLLPPGWALWVLLAGFASLMALDRRAALRGEAPLYFARLRPWQMAVPVLCLGALLWAV